MYVSKKRVALIVAASVIISSLLTFIFTSNGTDQVSKMFGNLLGTTEASTSEQPVHQPSSQGNKLSKEESDEFSRIFEAYSIIKDSYYDKSAVDTDKLIEGAIRGMVGVLNDPYSAYMDKDELANFEESLGSSFEGIGTEVMIQNNRVTIVSPFKDSPAEKAGLKPNDQIIAVDGENIEGLDLQTAVKKIRGPKGTKVKLEIIRAGLSEPLTIVVTRDTIPLESVYSEVIEADGKSLGKIQITSFSENTADRFFEEFNSLKRKGIKGLVIDVRGNPGGYLQAVLDIAQQLVPEGENVLQVEDRDGKRDQYKGKLKDKKFPIVILADKGSASASEILTAAMKEAGYPVVGQTTFGKGTVQVPKMMKDGGSIKITIAKWLTPDGNWIHQKGIEPSIPIEQPDYFNAAPIHAEEPIKAGTSGSEVQNLHLILKGLGYNLSREDSSYDQDTEKAVRDFQKTNGIKVTGEVDAATAQKMQEKLVEKMRDPKNDLQLQKALEVLAHSIK